MNVPVPIPNTRPAKLRRRRVVRWTLIASCVLIIVGLFATAGLTWYRGHLQRRRIAALEQFGGSMSASFAPVEFKPRPAFANGAYMLSVGLRARGLRIADEPPRVVRWLVPLFGEHCFTRVHDIDVGYSDFSDRDIDLVLAFPDLQTLDVSNTSLSDEGVKRLAAISKLVSLKLSFLPIKPETLRVFATCKALRELDISGTGIDEETVSSLQRALPDCEIVWDFTE